MQSHDLGYFFKYVSESPNMVGFAVLQTIRPHTDGAAFS